MRIAVIAHIRHAIAAPFMGGMEAHCATLCEGLAAAGHEPVLFCSGGSALACETVEICRDPYEAVLPWERWRGSDELERFQRHAFDRAWEAIAEGGFDVIHNNSLHPGLIDRAARDGMAMVTSQHVPPFEKMFRAVANTVGDARVRQTVTSHSQLALWFDTAPSNMAVVHNGIDCRFWRPGPKHGRLLWTGRITPNKGTAFAAMAAAHAGLDLDIAGPIEDLGYFEREVCAHLGGTVRYVGHLHGTELRDIVAGARAVCVTPMWAEPFGLVAAEALACDVPVIALDRGAMREVVGDCGTIVEGEHVSDLAKAMAAPAKVPRGRARERALALFSIERMIEGYVAEYRRAISATRSRLDHRGRRAA